MSNIDSLSTRLKEALVKAEITSLEEISPMTDREILRIQNVGQKGLREIRRAMIEAGIPIPGAYVF